MLKVVLLGGLIISGITLSAVSDATAHGGRDRAVPSFSDMDLNSDGNLTMNELQTMKSNRFEATDTNSDDVLTRDELIEQGQARVEQHVDKLLERRDANGDGALSRDEMRGGHDRGSRLFEHADADSNGLISEEEFDAAIEKLKSRHGKHRRH